MANAVNETLIREVIEDVLGRLGGGTPVVTQSPLAKPAGDDASCSCNAKGAQSGREFGVFQTADEACDAAAGAFRQLREQGVEARRRVIEIVKGLCEDNAEEWGRIELEETKIGRLDHKIEKLQIIRGVPGVEWLHPEGRSGDHGITLEEFTPFGVVGAVTPSTHSIPTLAGNIVNIVAAGNAVVFNAHPAASRCAAMAVRKFNEAIHRATGIGNIACIIEQPTLESFKAMCANENVRLLCVTGGPGVVAAAMQTGKRAICAGPGNPPVLVDDTADIDRAARCVVQGASYDNNLLCIGEKQVFVLDRVADAFMSAMERHAAVRLNGSQLDALTHAAFVFPEGQGAGCGHAATNKDFIGKDVPVLAQAAGVNAPAGTQLLFAETSADHLFVEEEQMMPMLPIIRVSSGEEGIEAA